ncbi:MAG: NAD-dependent epimerase/dehydratase family protein [Verrucomicrobia bacterium]|nr:NAD-dependent epimerase/dehydratase family protein [Verrucomicrobiota bacterium]
MQVLIIGGTGLISTGIVKHLLTRGASITMFNRGQRSGERPAGVAVLHGDRNAPGVLERACGARRWDVVIDMICFTPEQAQLDIQIFAGQCAHFIFCSTVCTYGIKVPPRVFIDESFPQEPISTYGKNKLRCEQLFLQAHTEGKFAATIIRPSHTYGPGHPLIDNLEPDPVAWDRIERGLPVLCAGDGLGLWVSTHRDDVGKLFAYGAMNTKTHGQAYNATHTQHQTWEHYYQTVAANLGKPVDLRCLPARKIWERDPARFGLLQEITGFHGAYNSSKATRDVPEFTCDIAFPTGAAETLIDARHRKALKSCANDAVYEQLVSAAEHAS